MNTAAPEPWALRSGEVPRGWGSALAHGYLTEDVYVKECVSHHRQRLEHCSPARRVRVLNHFRARPAVDPGAKASCRTGWRGSLFIKSQAATPPAELGCGAPATSCSGAPPLRRRYSLLQKALPRDLHPPTHSCLLDTWSMSQDGPRQQVARDQPPNSARHRATMLFQKLLCPRPVGHFCSVPGVVAVC